jgi:hypothetical protein
MAIMQTSPTVPGRSCEGCTKCCEGYLDSTVKVGAVTHELKINNPCVFLQVGKGCGVYNERPKDPCRDFRCQYLVDEMVPEEMKPSRSNVILTVEEIVPGVEYIIAHEAGGSLEGENLKWVRSLYDTYFVNIAWKEDGVWHYQGDAIFTANAIRKWNLRSK